MFTSGMDGQLKAWTIDKTNNVFSPVDSKNLGCPIHSLCMLPSNTLVAGLDNGQMATWDLAQNALNNIPAHNCAITSINRHDNYLMTGDAQGNIHVRDATRAALIL